MKSTICLVEDREVSEPSLRLLLLSLNRHCSTVPINLCYPPATEGFRSWIKKYPQVVLRTDPIAKSLGWNVKPRALMQSIDQGFDEVIWLDSDIIVNRDMLPIFAQLRSDVLVATEDSLGDQRDDPNALRAHLWGFPGGRVLPFVLNSSVLRITKEHYPLMERWWNLLQSDTYQDFQRRGWKQRPVHMRSDQDVLTALLTSKEFSQIPLHVLRRGKHILQFNGVYGYTLAERTRNLLSDGPVFIHSFGGKPWIERWRLNPPTGLKDYLNKVYLDLSPYTLAGMTFRNEMDCDTDWMEPHYRLSRILRMLGTEGYPEVVGLPIAAFMDLARMLKACKSLFSGDLRRVPLCH
jgi:hypothetical protein